MQRQTLAILLAAGQHTIEYVATNSSGSATSTRTVIIESPSSPQVETPTEPESSPEPATELPASPEASQGTATPEPAPDAATP